MRHWKLSSRRTNHLKKTSLGCLFLTIASLPPLVCADLTDRLYLSGFGTLGYSLLSREGPEYRLGQAPDGATSDGTFLLDTRLGLQQPVLEWAFARANLTDSWSVRVGRMALPSFNVSDFREVGYTNDLARPPEDTYLQIPIRRFNGIDLIGQMDWGLSTISLQSFYGGTEEDIQGNSKIEAENILGANISLSRGFARWRLSYLQTELRLFFDGFDGANNPFEPAAVAFPLLRPLVDSLGGKSDLMAISGISMELDFDRVFIDAEYTRFTTDSFLTNSDGWYVAAGFRMGAFTPFGFVSALKSTESEPPDFGIPDIPQTQSLIQTVNGFYEDRSQNTIGLGIRWDFQSGLALKAQAEHFTREVIGSSFDERTETDDAKAGKDVQMLSIVLDFIY